MLLVSDLDVLIKKTDNRKLSVYIFNLRLSIYDFQKTIQNSVFNIHNS